MAYRRKQVGGAGIARSNSSSPDDGSSSSSSSSSSSLAVKAIRASSAHKDSSLSSAYSLSPEAAAAASSRPQLTVQIETQTTRSSSPSSSSKNSESFEYTSMKSLNESKQGFWGALTRKAKSILEDDNVGQKFDSPGRPRRQMHDTPTGSKYNDPNHSQQSRQNIDSPKLQRGLNAITSSLNYIGGTIGNAVEEGFTVVENRTADIIQETRKHIRKKPTSSEAQNHPTNHSTTQQQPQIQPPQADLEIQLKASRDVAMAMAAKAKLLLRELKTVKADLAFAKERCAQLEEENKILRENRERGDNPEDDDLIRLQLETLLAEKARLAHENSIYTRENRFLREIVEYHQLTMQDVVYLDEGNEEVSEVYPIKLTSLSSRQSTPSTPPPLLVPSALLDDASLDTTQAVALDASCIPSTMADLDKMERHSKSSM